MVTNKNKMSVIAVNKTQNWLGNAIRHGIDSEGDIWFVLKDICDAIEVKNPSDVAFRLKRDHENDTLGIAEVIDSIGRKRKTTIVHEDLIYSYVIPRSKKPEAKKFCRWVGKVIRTIRKTGSYTPADPNEIQKLEIQSRQLDMQLCNMVATHFPNDTRMMFLMQEKLASLVSGQKAIESGEILPPLTVSEMMEREYTPLVVRNNRSSVGRMVAKKFRAKHGEMGTTEKYVNGHRVYVKVYPAQYHDEIEGWISDKMGGD
jgi:prophage antirepressor-like protein